MIEDGKNSHVHRSWHFHKWLSFAIKLSVLVSFYIATWNMTIMKLCTITMYLETDNPMQSWLQGLGCQSETYVAFDLWKNTTHLKINRN